MEFFKYKTVQLFIVALALAIIAIPFEEIDFVFMTLRLVSFGILMYLFIKLTSAKKKVKSKK